MPPHHLTQSLFDHKSADIACDVLNTVQNGRVSTQQMSVYWLLTVVIAGGLGATADQHRDRRSDANTASLGEDPHSKRQAQSLLNAYRFPTTAKSKNR